MNKNEGQPPFFFIFLVSPSVSIFSNTTLQQKYKKEKKKLWSVEVKMTGSVTCVWPNVWICWFLNYGHKKLVLLYCFWYQTMDTLIFLWSQSVKKDEWPQLTDGMSGDIWLGHGKGQFCHHWPMVKRLYEKTEIRYLY